MNWATNRLSGRLVELRRAGALHQDPPTQHGDPVAHRHRLDLVVGDVHRGDAEAPLELGDLGAGLHAELGVEVRQRLVHQEQLRLAHDRTTHRHALALAARQLAGLAVEHGGELEQFGHLGHLGLDDVLVGLAQLHRERDVLLDGHVRVERIALEHHRDVALLRAPIVDDHVVDQQLAARDVLEAGDHAQHGALAAARGADEDEELAVVDVQVEPRHGLVAVRVLLLEVLHGERRHERYPLTLPASRPRTKSVGARGTRSAARSS